MSRRFEAFGFMPARSLVGWSVFTCLLRWVGSHLCTISHLGSCVFEQKRCGQLDDGRLVGVWLACALVVSVHKLDTLFIFLRAASHTIQLDFRQLSSGLLFVTLTTSYQYTLPPHIQNLFLLPTFRTGEGRSVNVC